MPSSVAVQQARNMFKKGNSAQEVAQKLADLAVRRYTTDNVAVAVVDLGTMHDASAAKKGGSGKSKGLLGMFGKG